MKLRRVGDDRAQAPVSDGSALLELDGVCASYGSYRALFGVSFTVKPGAIVALLGSNGAGKSTRRESGERARGGNFGDRSDSTARTSPRLPAYRIARLGMVHVPEGRGIFSSLTVEENLLLSFRQLSPAADVSAALERAYTLVPDPRRPQGPDGGHPVGGPAADPRPLSGPRDTAAPSDRRRAVSRSRPGDRRQRLRDPREDPRDRMCGARRRAAGRPGARDRGPCGPSLAGLVAWSGPASEAAGAMDKVLGGRTIVATPEGMAHAEGRNSESPRSGEPNAGERPVRRAQRRAAVREPQSEAAVRRAQPKTQRSWSADATAPSSYGPRQLQEPRQPRSPGSTEPGSNGIGKEGVDGIARREGGGRDRAGGGIGREIALCLAAKGRASW